MKLKTVIALSLMLILALDLADQAKAASIDEKGFEIAARADRSDVGFGGVGSRIDHDPAGMRPARSRRDRLKIATLEKPDETVGDKSLVVFFHATRYRRHRAPVTREDPRPRRSMALPAGAQTRQTHRVEQQVRAFCRLGSSPSRISRPSN